MNRIPNSRHTDIDYGNVQSAATQILMALRARPKLASVVIDQVVMATGYDRREVVKAFDQVRREGLIVTQCETDCEVLWRVVG